MQLMILVTIITWSFGGGFQKTPSYQIVSSPEDAALAVYNDNKSNHKVEPDQKTYQLFKIDFSSGIVTEIELPSVEFKTTKFNDEK